MNTLNTINLVLGVCWLVMAVTDLVMQQPTAWYVSMLMCLALAVTHINSYITGRSA